MAQADLYLAEEDVLGIIHWLFSAGAWFVPSREYELPRYDEIMTPREFSKGLDLTREFYVLADSYYHCPLEMRRFSTGPKEGLFYLMPRNGGPALHLYCPLTYESDGVTFLPPGIASYYPTYWMPALNKNVPAPAELKSLFSDFLSFCKKDCTLINTGVRNFILGPVAAKWRKNGLRLVGIDD